jgi:hypothetical protein
MSGGRLMSCQRSRLGESCYRVRMAPAPGRSLLQPFPATAKKSADRYRQMKNRACGIAPQAAALAAPHTVPPNSGSSCCRSSSLERHRIADNLHLARSTGDQVLFRFPCPRLSQLDQATGLAVGRPNPVRYDPHPGDLVCGIEKLGRIPDGGRHRLVGRTAAKCKRT